MRTEFLITYMSETSTEGEYSCFKSPLFTTGDKDIAMQIALREIERIYTEDASSVKSEIKKLDPSTGVRGYTYDEDKHTSASVTVTREIHFGSIDEYEDYTLKQKLREEEFVWYDAARRDFQEVSKVVLDYSAIKGWKVVNNYNHICVDWWTANEWFQVQYDECDVVAVCSWERAENGKPDPETCVKYRM